MAPRALLLLALLLGRLALAQPDGGEPEVYDVLSADAQVRGADGGVQQVGLAGGCWLSTGYCVGYARELAAARAQIATYESDTSWMAPGWKWLVAAAGVGLAAGIGFGVWIAWKVLK